MNITDFIGFMIILAVFFIIGGGITLYACIRIYIIGKEKKLILKQLDDDLESGRISREEYQEHIMYLMAMNVLNS